MTMYILDIQLSRQNKKSYITVNKPPVGNTTSAQIQFDVPLETLTLSGGTSPQQIGHALYRAINKNQIGALIQRNIDNAYNDGGLRLQLTILSTALARCAWECLWNPAEDQPYALQGRISIARYVEVERTPLPINPQGMLRWLYAGASPNDQMPLDIVRESKAIRDALNFNEVKALNEFKPALNITLENFYSQLSQYDPHVIFLAAHGSLDSEGMVNIAFVDDYDDSYLIYPATLQGIFRERSVLVAILNICHSGSTSTRLNYGLAGSLLNNGLRSVIAMENTISEDTAQAFSRGFAESLVMNGDIDLAVFRGRNLVAQAIDNKEWAVPRLFVSSSDTIIWERSLLNDVADTENNAIEINYRIADHGSTYIENASGDITLNVNSSEKDNE